jgi:glutathione S-transferase
MHYVELVALLALFQFFGFGWLVGRARGLYGIKAPAVSGHEMFERIYRVQMNTLELLVMLFPALYLGATLWSPLYTAICGAVYLLGRIVYWRAYVSNPRSRSLGFGLSMGPILIILVAALVTVIKSLI